MLNKLNKNEKGLSVIEILLVIIIIALIGTVGYLVYGNHHQSVKNITITKPVVAPVKTTPKTTNNTPILPGQGCVAKTGYACPG